MKTSDKLLLGNKSWAQERNELDPTFFSRLSSQQAPEFLWIGCSDSRVPANVITSTDPGEIFVHRNIANVCPPNDLNMLSVVQYAVEVLKVKHVIVCGHYGCGGVQAAMGPPMQGSIEQWLKFIRSVKDANQQELTALPEAERFPRLVELNARAQAVSLAKSSVIQTAWASGQGPWVHAWVYALKDGVLNELESHAPGSLHA